MWPTPTSASYGLDCSLFPAMASPRLLVPSWHYLDLQLPLLVPTQSTCNNHNKKVNPPAVTQLEVLSTVAVSRAVEFPSSPSAAVIAMQSSFPGSLQSQPPSLASAWSYISTKPWAWESCTFFWSSAGVLCTSSFPLLQAELCPTVFLVCYQHHHKYSALLPYCRASGSALGSCSLSVFYGLASPVHCSVPSSLLKLVDRKQQLASLQPSDFWKWKKEYDSARCCDL